MHLGFALIMIGFLIADNHTGELSFGGLAKYFSTQKNIPLFLIFFAGFGIKAGIYPIAFLASAGSPCCTFTRFWRHERRDDQDGYLWNL
jgi:formate hydrogenlyase subunit 3/multisubunit Na+/H+ antiporter MnhD subunit